MNYLKQALTELLSGLTTRKNEKEIWTKDAWGFLITVEPIDDENYIIREYYENDQLCCEEQWKNERRNGFDRIRYKNGQLCREYQYQNGALHGICRSWYENGQVRCEQLYKNGKFVKTM